MILDFPGTLCLPPLLRTTIASTVRAWLSSILCHGYSMNFHSLSEITPILNVQRKRIKLKIVLRDLVFKLKKRMVKVIPRGRTKRGKSLLSVYVFLRCNYLYNIKKVLINIKILILFKEIIYFIFGIYL